MRLPQPPLLVISNRKIARRPLPVVARELAKAGCPWLMLREKDLNPEELAAEFDGVAAALADSPMGLSVNGSLALAARSEAIGVHLPQGRSVAEAKAILGPEKLVGQSAHSLAEVLCAAEEGADYVTVSPIFQSTSKGAFAPPLGLKELSRISAASKIPVIALGGVLAVNCGNCLEAGAVGVAVLGGVMAGASPGEACAKILTELGSRLP